MAWEPWQFLLSNRVRRWVAGRLLGEARPPRRPPPAPKLDARTIALKAFAEFLGEIQFTDTRAEGGDVPYRIPRDRILVDEPDDANTANVFPRLVLMPGEAQYLPFGTVPDYFEETRDLYGLGTVVACAHEYEEMVALEVWATTRAQRRMLASGIEQILATPIEEAPWVRLNPPGLFGETASFRLVRRQNVDDEDAMRRRRKATLTIELRVNLVRLVNYQVLRPAAAGTASEFDKPVPLV